MKNSLLNEKEERQQWLDSLKEGDKVAIWVNSYNSRKGYYEVHSISRITPTRRITIGNGLKFDNKGVEMGNSSQWTTNKKIQPITQEIIESIKRRKIVNKINEIKFENLSLEILTKIDELLSQEE